MSRTLLHFLLSLVLLVSQQMALAHGWSHLDQTRQHAHAVQSGQGLGASDGPASTALDDFCPECGFDAQLDVALPLALHALPLATSLAVVGLAQGVQGRLQAPLQPYQSRAPPRAN